MSGKMEQRGIGYDAKRNSYYPIGDPQYDPFYTPPVPAPKTKANVEKTAAAASEVKAETVIMPESKTIKAKTESDKAAVDKQKTAAAKKSSKVKIVSVDVAAPLSLNEPAKAVVEYDGEPVLSVLYRWFESSVPMHSFVLIPEAEGSEFVPTDKGGKYLKVEVCYGGGKPILSKAKRMPVE